MPTAEDRSKPAPWQRRLYLPAYSIVDAARYARTSPRTVSYWHYQGSPLGPALPGRERRVPLSSLQLVEVAFVATFRELGVSLQRLRRAREYLAQTFHAEYPFAQMRLKTEGQHILLDLQEIEPDTEVGRLIVADAEGQIAWKDLVAERFAEFSYENGLAVRWHVRGKESPVIIDPRVSFGAPTIRGVPTWAIRGRILAGEPAREIAEDFGLEEGDVLEALQFEGVEKAA